MNIDKLQNNIEFLAEQVHNTWWQEKEKQGFHSPNDCESENRTGYINSDWQSQERFDNYFDSRYYEWCDKCHSDMYPYNELPEHIKEYDRVTVRTVLNAIDKLG